MAQHRRAMAKRYGVAALSEEPPGLSQAHGNGGELVRQIEAEGAFTQAPYAFENGGLCRLLTELIEQSGKHWVSELEHSRCDAATIGPLPSLFNHFLLITFTVIPDY